jgi:hypothetical protein
MDHRLNTKPNTIKLLEENIRKKLRNLGEGRDLLNTTKV